MQTTTRYLINNGVKIAFQTIGDQSDIPLVMVMGLSGVKEDWRSLSHNLGKNRQVVVLDNRGLGESDVAPGPYSIETMANDVLAVTNELKLKKFDLMGMSMGGMICQHIAVHSPDLIHKLILMSTSHGGPGQAPMKPESAQAFQIDPNASAFEKTSKVMTVNFTPEWIEANPEAFTTAVNESLQHRRSGKGIFNQMMAVMNFNLENEIKHIDLPVLVIHGTNDQLIDVRNGEMIAEKIPGAQFIPIKGAGHMTWMVDNGETESQIKQYLTKN